MNRTYALCLSLAFAAAAGNALADTTLAGDISIDPNPFISTATRAQVMEELRQYRTAGINPWADDYNSLAHFQGSKTRDQVMAEFHGSRIEVAAFSGEDSGSTYLARITPEAEVDMLFAEAE